MHSMIKRIFNFMLSLLYPRKCPFCRQLINEKERVCKSCSAKLPWIIGNPPRRVPGTDGCYSVFRYEGNVRESLLRYKFASAAAYAEAYSRYLTKCIDENGIFCDIVTWVPLSRRSFRKRGYDQAQLLAEELSAARHIECARLLRKVRSNRRQSGIKHAAERKRNVRGVYEALSPELFEGKRVLLLDDILTTGSTVSECANTLRKAGAGSVTVLTVAARNI